MNKLVLAGAIAAVSVIGTSDADASSVKFYLGSSFGYSDEPDGKPDCGGPTGGPKVAYCDAHGMDMTIKAYTMDQDTGKLGYQINVADLYHNGFGSYSNDKYDSSHTDGWGTDEGLVLHFDHAVKLTKLGFSHVDKNDDVMVAAMSDVDYAPSEMFTYDLHADGTNSKGGYNGNSKWEWISLPHMVSDMFLVGTTDWKDDWGLKYVYVEKIDPVPLPAAGWMLIAGMGGLAAMKRRSKKKS